MRSSAQALAAGLAAWLLLSPFSGAAPRKPGRGTLLVASSRLLDPNFYETVVLLFQADEQGAGGVVINRRTDVPVAEAMPGIKELAGRPDHLYRGGPVAATGILVLARSERPLGDADAVLDKTYLVRSSADLEDLLRDGAGEDSLRVFAGHAGWAPGQLEAEIARGDWHLVTGSPRWVFDEEPPGIWSQLLALALAPVV